jgi:hypothetical protein
MVDKGEKPPILTFDEAESLFFESMDEPKNDREFDNLSWENVMKTWYDRREAREKHAHERIAYLYGENFDLNSLELHTTRGDWAVTNYGVLCLDSTYVIDRNRVYERGWISHMDDKGWVNMYDFLRCLLYARVKYAEEM